MCFQGNERGQTIKSIGEKGTGWIVGPNLPNAHAVNPWGLSTHPEKGGLVLQHRPPLAASPCVKSFGDSFSPNKSQRKARKIIISGQQTEPRFFLHLL